MVRFSHALVLISSWSPDAIPPKEYRRNVGAHLSRGNASDRAEKVLALLIESGFLYCFLWVITSPAPASEAEERRRLLTTICAADILLVDRFQTPPRLWLVHGQPGHAFSLSASATVVELSSRVDCCLHARRLVKRVIIPVQTPRAVCTSPPSTFQLAKTRQISIFPRYRHRAKARHIPRSLPAEGDRSILD